MRKYFTTTEYIKALKRDSATGTYECKGKEFQIYATQRRAEQDAEWVDDYFRRQGIKDMKPEVLEITFRSVRKLK